MELAYYHEYARMEDSHWWFQGRRFILRRLMRRWMPKKSAPQILDIGCGTGAMLEMLREFGHVEGLDNCEAALLYCRQRLGAEAVLHLGELPNDLPLGKQYDVITAFDVLEHLPNPVATLQKLAMILAPGGSIICTVPSYMFLWSRHDEINHHRRRYSRTLLKAHAEQAGFKTAWSSYFNAFLFAPIALVRFVRNLLPYHDRSITDFRINTSLANSLLRSILAFEGYCIGPIRFPFGVSLVAVLKGAGAQGKA